MPPIRPERARNLLSATDRAPQRSRRPLSLRQGALLALIAAGLTAHEIANLQASAITMELGHLLVTVRRHGVIWEACLPADLAPHLLAWLSERRLWGEPAPVFTGRQGRLTPTAVYQALHRYRQKQRNARG
jgi:site-specific recombinase XerD